MSCQCYQVGGPFIAEDPDCFAHGWTAQRRQEIDDEEKAAAESRIEALERDVRQLFELVNHLIERNK